MYHWCLLTLEAKWLKWNKLRNLDERFVYLESGKEETAALFYSLSCSWRFMNFELEWLRGFLRSNDTVCKLGKPAAFILVHYIWNRTTPQSRKGFFHLTIKNRWASFCQVTATCRGHTTQRKISPPCVLENYCENLCLRNRILSPQHVRTQKNQIRQNLCDLSRRQNLLQKKRFFHKNSPVHTKWCVAVTCC